MLVWVWVHVLRRKVAVVWLEAVLLDEGGRLRPSQAAAE